jgi:aspartate racemase
MKSLFNKTIGIIGGMGPQASSKLYDLLIKKAIGDFNVQKDEDFPDIVLFSVAVPNFVNNNKNKIQALKILKRKIKQANRLNLLCLSIACNTAHVLVPEFKKISNVPFISIIDEVSNKVMLKKIKKVGLLASPMTIKTKLYEKALNKRKIKIISPKKNQLNVLEKIIKKIILGTSSKNDQNNLKLIAISLKNRGAKGIILGCTELPLIFPKKFKLPIFNSLEILADCLLSYYFKHN